MKHVEVGYCDTSVNDCGTRGEVSTIVYMMRSLMTRTEKNEPTIAYSGMYEESSRCIYRYRQRRLILGKGPTGERGHVSAGLVDIEEALEEQGEYIIGSRL